MNHKDLDAWKSSMLLAKLVYDQTKDFPTHEQFALTSQIRHAAISIPANIAEGSARKGNRELIQFLHISLGSIAELETLFLLAKDLDYISESKSKTILELITTCSKLVFGLIKYLKGKL